MSRRVAMWLLPVTVLAVFAQSSTASMAQESPPSMVENSTAPDEEPPSRKREREADEEFFAEVDGEGNDSTVSGGVAVRQTGADGQQSRPPSDLDCESEPHTENDLVDPVFDFTSGPIELDGEQAFPLFGRKRTATTIEDGALVHKTSYLVATTRREYSPTGRWIYLRCEGAPGEFGFADIAPVGGPSVTIGELFNQALLELDPPVHDFALNPEGKQVVQFPTLFWIDQAYWETERAATRSNGNVSLTLRLVPFETEWDPGDGSDPVVCDGPGLVWELGMDEDSFACKHTYKTVEGQPLTATSTIRFRVETETNSNEVLGPFPSLERIGTAEVEAREIQVVESNA